MTPAEVKQRVIENEVWENAVWVNQQEKLFFVPIWRNGNTAFMNDIAEQFNFTLEKDIDFSDYTGFTMVRNPVKRLAGQIWRACENHNHSIDYVVTNLLEKNEVDMHLSTQTSFLKPYKIDYYLDLDNLKFTGHTVIDQIIAVLLNPKPNRDSQHNAVYGKQIEDYLEKHSDKIKLIESYYAEDYNLYYSVAGKSTVGILGLGKIGTVLKQLLEENNIAVSAYDPKKITDTLDCTVSSDIIWICVDTPSDYSGDDPGDQPTDYNTDNLKAALSYARGKPVIISSTVSPGTCNSLTHDAELFYMPFLISQGDVKQGLINPDAWFLGSNFDTAPVEKLVKTFSNSKIKTGTLEEIELVKVLYNSWIIHKINFANWAGDLARTVGNANGNKIMRWLADSNQLITSNAYMRSGWGDGGPCHPRDNLMLSWLNQKLNLGYDPAINQHNIRLAQANLLVKRVIDTKLPVCILGKSYKPQVSDITGSYSVLVAKLLAQHNVEVCFEDADTNNKDYCYVLAHGKMYGHAPSLNSIIINMWEE